MNYEQKIISIIKGDYTRCNALEAAASLDLPDWLIAAGFVRNAIWDHVYGVKTDLNDIDVIYFCKTDSSEEYDVELQQRLSGLEPNLPWSVKNQARMHIKNNDAPYLNTKDAMSYWPEKQTSIGVKLDKQGDLVLQHCFRLALQFNGKVDHNPVRTKQIFRERVAQKLWQKAWPKLAIEI